MLGKLAQALRGDARDKWYGMARIGANAALRVGFAVAVARIGGRDPFAVFVALVAVEVVAGTLLSAGWVTAIGSLVPRVVADQRDRLLGHAHARMLRACVAITVALAAGAPLAAALGDVPALTWLAFCASTGAWLASSGASAALAARFRSRRALVAQLAAAVAPTTAIAWAAWSGADVVIAFFAGHAAGHAAATVAMGRALPAATGTLPEPLARELRSYGRVVLVGSVANSACSRVQPFVLAAVAGAPAVASFGAANSLVGPARVFSGALGDVLRPRLALHQGAQGDPRRGRRALALSIGALGVLALGMLTAFVAFGTEIAVLVFGAGFEELGAVLPWAAVFVAVAAVVNVLVVAMQSRSLSGTAVATRARIAVALLSLASVWPACALDGARGAFVAMAAAESVFLAVAARFLTRTDASTRVGPALAGAS